MNFLSSSHYKLISPGENYCSGSKIHIHIDEAIHKLIVD